MIELKNKCIWIVGASTGIGEAVAEELARRGALVALTSRRPELLEQVKARIVASGGRADIFPGDVLNLARMKEIPSEIKQRLASVDILFSNAGSHIETKPEKFDSREYISLMQLNFGGLMHSIEAVLPEMITRGAGYVVGVASVAGYRGLPSAGAYGASKAAMINFLESLTFHLQEKNIPVTIVNPGFVKTPLTDKNNFPMPFLTDVGTAARIICNGMARQKRVISFPFPFTWIMQLGRVLPYPIYSWIVERLWSRMPKN